MIQIHFVAPRDGRAGGNQGGVGLRGGRHGVGVGGDGSVWRVTRGQHLRQHGNVPGYMHTKEKQRTFLALPPDSFRQNKTGSWLANA